MNLLTIDPDPPNPISLFLRTLTLEDPKEPFVLPIIEDSDLDLSGLGLEEIFMTNSKLSPELGKMQQTYIEVNILLCAMSVKLKKRVHATDRILHVYQAIYLYVTGRV